MIRGTQKKMIVIRTHESRVFEEAYFVMRRDTRLPADDSDMLTEADRIIRRSAQGLGCGTDTEGRSTWKRHISRLLWLLSGMILGGGGVGLLWWLG